MNTAQTAAGKLTQSKKKAAVTQQKASSVPIVSKKSSRRTAMIKRLVFPAPSRDWFQLPSGPWGSRAWTQAEVLAAKAGGAWFAKGRHDFADFLAAREAGVTE